MRTPKRRPIPRLKTSTIRDFGGGLNVIDTELNLTSKYSPVFDNAIRFPDGSVAPRWGYETWCKLRTGIETATQLPLTASIVTAANSEVVLINWTAHGIASPTAQHITFFAMPNIAGIPASDLNRTHSLRVVNANQLAIVTRGRATSAVTYSPIGMERNCTIDTHPLGGNPVEMFYFNNYLIVVSDIGEIIRIDEARVIQRIWSHTIAHGLGGSPLPWRETTNVAYDYYSGGVILSNGRDKPLLIDFSKTNIVDYLVDPGNSNSNAQVPAFDICKSAFRYFIVRDSETTASDQRTQLRITSKNTSMVFSSAPSPGDAVDIDVAKLFATSDSAITGLAVIKDNLMAIMPTASVLLNLGTYITVGTSQVHEPSPVDVMPNFGTNSPRSIVESGNDVFMLDSSGVPSARLSSLQNTIVPERVSQLIEPMISAHLGRLSPTTLRNNAFGFYDLRNRTIHFYAPKYDVNDVRLLGENPLGYSSRLNGQDLMYVTVRDHQFEEGDLVDVSGALYVGEVNPSAINGTRRVMGIVDRDTLLIEIGTTINTFESFTGGGTGVSVRPVSDETVGYMYHYVPALRINAWSRVRGMNFIAGCMSAEGRAFLVTSDSIMRYGSVDEPVYADYFNNFDAIWSNSTAYAVGAKIRDNTSGRSYVCNITHTSPSTGTFAQARVSDPNNWSLYKGEPIKMHWELPWADIDKRQNVKSLRHIHFDTQGTAQFTVKMFVDNIYRDRATGRLDPTRQMQFTAGDTAGFGAGAQPYGGGRRTREQLLWNIPTNFKIMKLRFEADVVDPLRISAVSFTYLDGSFIRG